MPRRRQRDTEVDVRQARLAGDASVRQSACRVPSIAMRPTLFVLAGLAACAYVDPDPAWADRQARFVDAQAFAPAKDELRGIDPPAPADRVEKGDRILYGI